MQKGLQPLRRHFSYFYAKSWLLSWSLIKYVDIGTFSTYIPHTDFFVSFDSSESYRALKFSQHFSNFRALKLSNVKSLRVLKTSRYENLWKIFRKQIRMPEQRCATEMLLHHKRLGCGANLKLSRCRFVSVIFRKFRNSITLVHCRPNHNS